MATELPPTPPPSPPTPPPEQGDESGSATAGQALKFLGIMLIAGGSLAMMRTRGVHQTTFFEGSPWLFLLLIPVGIATYVAGFYMCGRAVGDRDDG